MFLLRLLHSGKQSDEGTERLTWTQAKQFRIDFAAMANGQSHNFTRLQVTAHVHKLINSVIVSGARLADEKIKDVRLLVVVESQLFTYICTPRSSMSLNG